MKFLFALLALFVCASAQNDASLRTKCTYFADKLVLNCKGPSGTVECEALSILPDKFKILGLGVNEDKTSNSFPLYALKTDNKAWFFHTFMLKDKQFSLTISTTAQNGLRVKDSACFEKLSALFKSSTSNLSVPLEKSSAARTTAVGSKASLFGEIFVFNKTFNKKNVAAKKNIAANKL